MSTIDERIVQMKFNASQFMAGVGKTNSALDSLKKGLNLDGATKSIEGLDAAGKKFSLSSMATGIETISSKFSALSIMGITALTNLTNKAVNAGMNIAKSLTIEPVMDGFNEYELKMGSIQTILANTSRHGTGLAEVTSNLEELNLYADKTIYNFGDMTRNIGLFTNAGIKIGDATSMIKGFSNEAAASGTTAEGASGAAYQLSQALSAGTIRLMDWKSLSNVGMGNKNMQNGLIELAQAMGTFEGKSITAEEAASDFNGSLEKEWLSADVMQNYLQIQAGDLSDAQMKTIGLTGEQITAFKKQQTIAEEAATKVRTWTQLLGTLQEGVGSGWGQTFETLIGDFDQATKMWTAVNDTLGPMIAASGDARNKMLTEWANLGGRDKALGAISNGFKVLMSVLTPIIAAFKEIFPPMTGRNLLTITNAVFYFTKSLIPAQTVVNNLKRTFMGVFAVLDIGRMIIVEVVKMIFKLLGSATKGSGGFLLFTARIGDWLVALRDAIKNGEGLSKFFSGLTAVLRVPIELIKKLAGWIGSLFEGMNGIDTSGFEKASDRVTAKLGFLEKLGTVMKKLWEGVGKIFEWVAEVFGPLGQKIGDFLSDLGHKIADGIGTLDFSKVLALVNTGLLGGLVLMLKNFLKGGVNVDFGGGILDGIKETFGGLTDTMGAMQAQLKAGTLMKIAIAIALLTASVVALSLIDPVRLASALGGMTVMFMQLLGAMAVMEKISASSGFIKMPFIAASLILLGGALLILSFAVSVMAKLSWNELAKGLTGVTILLGGLVTAANMMKGTGPGMITAGIGLMAMAIAIRILVGAVTNLAGLSWGEMTQGIVGVSGLMLAMAGLSKIIQNPAGIVKTAFAMLIMGAAINVLAVAVEKMGSLPWKVMVKGLIGASGALVGIGFALSLIPKGAILSAAAVVVVAKALEIIQPIMAKFGAMDWVSIAKAGTMLAGTLLIIAGAMYLMTSAIFGAAALIVVAQALAIIADPLEKFGAMSWDAILHAGVVLAGLLLIIAGGMALMSGAIPGALALIVVAQALAILTPVLTTLGGMSWDEIVHGLVALAGVFAVIGLAGLLLTPIVGTILALGISISLLGIGMMGIGVGLLAFSAGLAALAVSGSAGAAALVVIVTALLSLIPIILKQLGLGIIAFAEVIATGAPALVKAVVAVVTAILAGLTTLIPIIIEFIGMVITLLIAKIVELIPIIVDAGVKILTAIIDGITVVIPLLIALVVSIITQLLAAVDGLIGLIVETGVKIVVALLEGIKSIIYLVVAAAIDMIMQVVNAIVALVPWLVDAGMKLVIGILDGIANNIGRLVESGLSIITNFINGITAGIPGLVEAGVNMIVTFVESLANSIRNNSSRMNAAGADLASAIIDGMVGGIAGGVQRVIDGAVNLGKSALQGAKDILGIKSPSREFFKIGAFSGEGMVGGIVSYGAKVAKASSNMGKSALTSIKDTMSNIGSTVSGNMNLNPTIKPVLDLSSIKKDAGQIKNLMGVKPIQVQDSYVAAASISEGIRLRDVEIAQSLPARQEVAGTTFIQNNNSPKALSHVTLYRQTKNLIGSAKG